MTSAPIIICDPELEQDLKRRLPEAILITMAKDTVTCQTRVSALDDQGVKQAIILFVGQPKPLSNQPVKDHINLSKQNALIGPADLSKGPRFPDMSSVYLADKGVIAVLGEDEDLADFHEDWVAVKGGVWEAIALKHRGYDIEAWIISDLEKWISETSLFN